MPIKMRPLYFGYGSNLDMEQMAMRCPDSRPLYRVKLEGHTLRYRRGVATIEEQEGSEVYGAVYEMSQDDLANLDRYEGYPSLYKRKTYKLKCLDTGKTIYATGYYMHDHYPYSMPSLGYFNIIRKGYIDWGLPINHFIQKLDNFKAELPKIKSKLFQKHSIREYLRMTGAFTGRVSSMSSRHR